MTRDPALHQLITAIAREYDLRVEYDTHYDAFNWEILWWADNVLNAVDIQPFPEGWLEVSRLRTHYPLWPRLLAWMQGVVPTLPVGDRTTREPLARLAWSCESKRLREIILAELPHKQRAVT